MPDAASAKQAQRFAVSGALVTAFHVAIAATLIGLLQVSPAAANGTAFILATVLSYAINTLWSFSRPLHGMTLVRFVAVSLCGLALTVAISGLAEIYGLNYWLGIAGVVLAVPPVTFLLHKAWTYKEDKLSDPGLAPTGDLGLWLAMLNGVIIFFALTRGSILDPRNIDWLLRASDPATSFVGWRFFRQSPVFQVPFGANPNYGMEIGSSVVFSDSIPLLAFLFKPFTSLLPGTFQYFGLWILLSFVLQSIFAYKLLRRFSEDRWLSWIGSVFFAIAPVCLARLEGHFALFGQWLVLAALYLYFAPRFSLLSCVALLSISALIHFYLLTMVGFIWAADLWQRRWRHEISAALATICLVTGVVVTLVIMWLAGYFMVGFGIAQGGFGIFRMNLLSMINPDGLWSVLLPDQPGDAGEHEGFAYLGIGVLLLALLAGYELLRGHRETFVDRRSVVPLLFVSLALIILALSNHVAFGSLELIVYMIPDVLRPFTDALRSSGRMFWPVYYLIYVAIFIFLFRRLARRIAIGVFAALLTVQVADSWAAFRHFSDILAYPPAWSSPLKSPLWAEIGKRYKRIIYVYPRNNAPDDYLPWAVLAADHGMAMNFGYFARVNWARLYAARAAAITAVRANRLKPESLYVFGDEALWTVASAQSRPSDVVGVIDGFRIIAPKLKECAACDLRAISGNPAGIADTPPPPARRH
jgi:putative flippase GtrA